MLAQIVLFAAVVAAVPTTQFASVLSSSSSAVNVRDLPVGKTPISRNDMRELARLAQAVNEAYCPPQRDFRVEPSLVASAASVKEPHFKSPRHKRRRATSHRHASVLITSEDTEFEHLAGIVDMNWYIAHTPETQTLTLAFSSLPSVDDFVEILASDPGNKTEPLVDLPAYIYPPESIMSYPEPRIHHSLLPALESHGTAALIAVLDLLESPPLPPLGHGAVLAEFLKSFAGRDRARRAAATSTIPSIRHVEITGHGLGAGVGLLVALALWLETSGPAANAYDHPLKPVDISAVLFGLPRVGDQAFADWVDNLGAESAVRKYSNGPLGVIEHPVLRINRVTSYADTIAHLPARHLDLAHPSRGELWVGADPRVAYVCRSPIEHEESEVCAESIPLAKTSLLDHAGPFGGVWIGASACRRGGLL